MKDWPTLGALIAGLLAGAELGFYAGFLVGRLDGKLLRWFDKKRRQIEAPTQEPKP